MLLAVDPVAVVQNADGSAVVYYPNGIKQRISSEEAASLEVLQQLVNKGKEDVRD